MNSSALSPPASVLNQNAALAFTAEVALQGLLLCQAQLGQQFAHRRQAKP